MQCLAFWKTAYFGDKNTFCINSRFIQPVSETQRDQFLFLNLVHGSFDLKIEKIWTKQWHPPYTFFYIQYKASKCTFQHWDSCSHSTYTFYVSEPRYLYNKTNKQKIFYFKINAKIHILWCSEVHQRSEKDFHSLKEGWEPMITSGLGTQFTQRWLFAPWKI